MRMTALSRSTALSDLLSLWGLKRFSLRSSYFTLTILAAWYTLKRAMPSWSIEPLTAYELTFFSSSMAFEMLETMPSSVLFWSQSAYDFGIFSVDRSFNSREEVV